MKKLSSTPLALSAMIALTTMLAACNGGGSGAKEPDAPANPPAASSEPAASGNDSPGSGPLDKYDPPIEVSVIRGYDENTKFVEGDDAENNEWTRAYEERLRIKIKFAWTFQGPGDQYNQKLNVSIASNDLADIVTVNANQLNQLVEAGQIADLTEVYEQYASDYVKTTLNGDGGLSLKSATFDGKLMAIPRIGSDIDEVPILFVRSDWMKKLNLPEPKTMADVLAISDAFTNQDPDGNGQADTVGLSLSKDLNGGFPGFEGFLNGYHAYFNTWLKDDSGKLVYSTIQPEMKTALAELQRMYADKEIDKEFGTQDGTKAAEAVTSGKVGMYFGAMWTPLWPGQGGKELDPDMEWQPYPIVSADDKPLKAQIPFNVGNYYVVKKDAEHPEAAIKMLNLYYDIGFDTVVEPEKYWATPDGIETFKHAIIQGAPFTYNMDKYKAIKQALETKDDSKVKANYIADYKPVVAFLEGDIKGWGSHKVFGPGGSFSVIEKYVADDMFLRNAFYGSPTPTMAEKGSTLDSLTKETFTKIIMGAAPIDEFDTYVENWKKLGGEQMTQEVNDWYAMQ